MKQKTSRREIAKQKMRQVNNYGEIHPSILRGKIRKEKCEKKMKEQKSKRKANKMDKKKEENASRREAAKKEKREGNIWRIKNAG